MHTLLTVLHVMMAVSLITVILLQHGKGADAGAAFGSGASATVFGARGATSFLTKLTWGLVVIFFAVSFALNNMAADLAKGGKSVMERTSIKGDSPSRVIESGVEPVEAQEDAAPATPSDLPEIPLSGDNADAPPIPEPPAPEPVNAQDASAPSDAADRTTPKAQEEDKSSAPASSAPAQQGPEAAARPGGQKAAAKPAAQPQDKPAAAPKPAAENDTATRAGGSTESGVSSTAKTPILKTPAEGKPAAPPQGKSGSGQRE